MSPHNSRESFNNSGKGLINFKESFDSSGKGLHNPRGEPPQLQGEPSYN
jgi:hypothetical protein